MSTRRATQGWLPLIGAFMLPGAAALTIAVSVQLWVLAAIPIGLLFGFFLQKGDLCGAAAMSEVLLMRDARKLLGVWTAIVAGMAAAALLELLGWATLAPKPLQWQSALVGGVVFGAGTVLAGGCVSGCMFKAAAGNINSMAGLAAIPMGVAMVEYGPLRQVNAVLKTRVVKTDAGDVVSLPSVTGIPQWGWALLFAAATVGGAWWWRRRRAGAGAGAAAPGSPLAVCPADDAAGSSRWARALRQRWRPWQAGLAIGLLLLPAYLSSAASGRNYPLGVTHGMFQIQQLLADGGFRHVWRSATPPTASSVSPALRAVAPAPAGPPTATGARASPAGDAVASSPAAPARPIVWWLVALSLATMLGAWTAARLEGRARLLPKPPDETLTAFGGGILVGAGAGIAGGCVIGNIMSGWALLSVGMFLFGLATLLGNWAVTWLYLMGGTAGPSRRRLGGRA